MDYYNTEKKYPDTKYIKNNGEKVITKTIRITSNEAKNWDSKKIHAFLQNNQSENKLKMNMKIIQGYKQIYHLFNDLLQNSSEILKKHQVKNFKNMISNHIDVELLKEINEEINLK